MSQKNHSSRQGIVLQTPGITPYTWTTTYLNQVSGAPALCYYKFELCLALGAPVQAHPVAHDEVSVFPHLTSAVSTPTHV